jgi:predicted phosphoribosyltransferase
MVARAGEAFAPDRAPLGVSGKAVLVVDDGLATGLTALAAVDYLRRSGAALVVLAAPVASRQAIEKLKPSVDRLVVVEVPPDFRSVGQFYLNFDQTQDAEVVELLSRADKLGPG